LNSTYIITDNIEKVYSFRQLAYIDFKLLFGIEENLKLIEGPTQKLHDNGNADELGS